MASSARIDELRRKFDENPRRYFASLANEYRKGGDAAQAIFICQEYLPQQPGHMSGHIVYGQALFDLARYDDARAVFDTALALDPENLIALRHLGDIARTLGDIDTARSWYQRVLEADPRNEEIAQLLLSLLSNDTAPQAPSGSPSGPAANTASMAVAQTPEPPSPAGVETGYVPEAVGESTDNDGHAEAPRAPEGARKVSPHAPTEADLLDLDDFDLGGVPLSELRAASPAPVYEPAQAFDEATASGIEMPPMIGAEDVSSDAKSAPSDPGQSAAAEMDVDFLTIGVESEPGDSFQADPFAIAASSISTDFEKEEEPPIQPLSSLSVEPSLDSSPDTPVDDDFRGGFVAWSTPSIDSTDAVEPANELHVELATDLHLGLADDSGGPPMTLDSMSTLDDLETFEAGTFVVSPAELEISEEEALQTDPFFDVVGAEPAPSADDSFAASSGPPEVFMTETMAELYLEQGHLEPALAIYRRLAEQRPDDAALAARMQTIERRLHGTPAQVDGLGEHHADHDLSTNDAASVASNATMRAGGQTIREFLRDLIRRSPRGASSVPSGSGVIPVDETISMAYASGEGDAGGYAGFDDDADIDEPFAADPAYDQSIRGTSSVDVPVDAHRTSSVIETAGPSLEALFSGADGSASDAAAARTLSQAFATTGPDTAALEGMPAHRAKDELSLDHVFKANAAPRAPRDGDGFSFDQFFSEQGADGAALSHGEAGAPDVEGADDIAQFNAWLNGLKQT